MRYKYLFGPVPSRRLGMSLGIDLIPHKTCSLDCIYCECGKTTILTYERKEYVPLKDVIIEIGYYLKNKPYLDYITFSGSGEPLLHNGIGKIADFIKSNFPDYKIALLTNSVLLGDKQVQEEIKDIDAVLPSLDAVSEKVFKNINRSVDSIKILDIINGLIDFSKIFKGEIWIEIFLVPGINDDFDELKLFKEILPKIRYDKIQLNSLDRPGTLGKVKKIDKQNLIKVQDFFKPIQVEIISKFNAEKNDNLIKENIEDEILSMIKRRPCTALDLSASFKLDVNEINIFLKKLLRNNKIEVNKLERGIFYKLKI